MKGTIGLIAGNRRLPFLWTEQAKAAGYQVAAVGFKGETDPKLAKHVDAFAMVELGELGKLLKFFKAHGVDKAVMQGQIMHAKIHGEIKSDWAGKWLLAKHSLFVRDFRTEAMLGSVAKELAGRGVQLQPATWLMDPHIAQSGHLAGPKPDRWARKNIAFGLPLTRELNKLDVGQTVVFKRQSVVAVESIEGTDACIERAFKLAGPGCVVIKLARPKQDLRFDLPVVGPKTFQVLAKAKASALVLEPGKSLFLERERCEALAATAKLSVLAPPR
jgi:DUF1009 family protein